MVCAKQYATSQSTPRGGGTNTMSSMIRRFPMYRAVAVLALALGLFAVAPASAGAAARCVAGGDYAGTMQLGVNPTTTTAGSQVTITGTGYPKNCELTVYVDGEAIGVATTDGNGTFSLPWTVPPGTPVSQLEITTNIGGMTETAILDVVATTATTTVAPVTPGGSSLPATGSKLLPLLAGGVAILVLGSLGVLSTRKRTRQV